MDLGIAIIASSLIINATFILILMINQSNWFKKENFKLHKKNILDENRIKLKKIERDLGLTSTKQPGIPTNLIMEGIKGLSGGGEEGEEEAPWWQPLAAGFFKSEYGQQLANQIMSSAAGGNKELNTFER